MKIVNSFKYAFEGLSAAFREQLNLRIHIAVLVSVGLVGSYFHFSFFEWCSVILSAGLVIGLELINTAVESLTDLVTKERNSHAGRVKDIAAAAVLVGALAAGLVGSIILYNHLGRGPS